MGKQIRFLQSQKDLCNFLDKLEKCNACIFVSYMNKKSLVPFVKLADVSTFPVGTFFIVSKTYLDEHKFLLEEKRHPTDAGLIQFTFYIPKSEPQDEYKTGRIYIAKDPNTNEYSSEATTLYKELNKYIKKNYFYNKEDLCYVGPDFLAKHPNADYVVV